MTINELEIINIDARDRLKEASKREYYRIGTTLDEDEARAMVNGILQNHAGIVLDTVAKAYIHNRATVEVLGSFIKERI